MKKLIPLLFSYGWLFVFQAAAQTPVVTRIEPSSGGIGHLVKIIGKNLGGIDAIRFGSATPYTVTVLNDSTLKVVVRGAGPIWTLEDGNVSVATTNLFTYQAGAPTGIYGGVSCTLAGITRVRILNTSFDTKTNAACISNSPKWFDGFTTDTLKSDTTYQVEVTHSSFGGISLFMDYNNDGDFTDIFEYVGTSPTTINGPTTLTMVVPQHTAGANIKMVVVQNGISSLPHIQIGSITETGANQAFRLTIFGTVGGPQYCYTSLNSNCPPAALQIDSVFLPEFQIKRKVSPCSTGYKIEKRSILAHFVQGRNYTFNMKQTGTAQAMATAWLDMNRNGDFADQFPIFQSSNLAGPPTVNSFSVPINTSTNPPSTGLTRLRVRLDAGSATMVPCSSSASSYQTIDYLVQIEKATPNTCTPTGPANGCNGNNGLSQMEIPGTDVNTPLSCPANNASYQLLTLNTRTEDTLETGKVYKIRLRTQFAGSVAVWADWNGDGRLIASDWLGSAESAVAGSWVEILFTVPQSASIDRLLFRVRTKTGSSFEPLESCATTNGNTYDFTMVIKKGSSTAPIQYCTDVQTNNCTALINSLGIRGTSFSMVNPTCTGTAYRNFAPTGSATASLQPGQNYILSWTGVSNLKLALWADWDGNGIFQESEFVGGSGNSFLLRRNPRFSTVPQVRLRIRASATQDFTSFDACTQRNSGVTFDFTLSTPQVLCVEPLKKPVSCDTVAFQITNVSNPDDFHGFGCDYFQNSYKEIGSEYFRYFGYSNLMRMDSAGAYADFGIEFLVNNLPAFPNKRVAVWADWNGNEIFEANEFASLGSNTDWKNIQVGPGAVGTTVRVRYRIKAGTTAFTSGQSCTPFTHSVTMDFFLEVGKKINSCPILINRRNCSGTPTNYIERITVNEKPLFDFADICVNPPVGTLGYHAFYPYGQSRANVKPGSSAKVKVKINTPLASSIVFGWIDWDRDGTYFPTEYFELTGTSTSLYEGTITVPANAKSGMFNGRIRHYPLPAFEEWQSSACKEFNPSSGSDADFAIRVFEDCPDKPSIQTPQGTVVCPGGAVQLSVTPGGNQVRWSTGATSNTINVFQPGLYRVALQNSVCLSDSSDPVQITAGTTPPQPSITAPVTSICQGDSALLTGPAGFTTYQWSNGGPNRPFIWVKNNSTITLRVSNGCISPVSAPVTVSVSTPPPAATTTPTGSVSLCTGDSVLLSAPAGFQYSWSTGQTSRTIWAKSLGVDYTVRLISGACTSAVSPVVSLEFLPKPPTPVITSTGNLTFCSGDSVRLSAPSGFSYQWSNGASTREIWVKQSGTFSVRTFLVAGCLSQVSNSISVTVNPSPPKPNISPAGPIGICEGDSIRLLSVAGGLLPTIWSTGATTPFLWVKTSGSYTAQTVLNGCTSLVSEPKVVTVSPKPARPSITLQGNPSFCQGDSVRLTAIFSGNGVQWSNGSAQNSIWVKQTGVYYVNAFVNAQCQSDTSLPVSITSRPKPGPVPITRPASTSICAGDSVLLQAPAGFASYRWSNGRTSASIYAKTAGRYSVQVAGANGCFSDTLGFYTSGLYFFPAGATDGDSIHIFLNPGLTCPLPSQNPASSMQGTTIARLHSGVTLNGTDWQNVVSTTTPALEPQTRFRNLAGGWFTKSLVPKTYYNTGNQTASQICLVTNGGNPTGGWFEREGKLVTGGPCADFFIPLPIRRNAFANPFAVSVTVQPNPTVTISQSGGQLSANPNAGLQFQWLLDGQPIVGATGAGFSVSQPGSYSLVATNNQNCRDTSNVILITSSQPLARENRGIQLYPNPVAKTLLVEANLPGMVSAELEWFDLQGKRLFTETLYFENGKAELDLSSRNLPKALYPIRIQTPGGSEWRRVMKE